MKIIDKWNAVKDIPVQLNRSVTLALLLSIVAIGIAVIAIGARHGN